VTTSKPKNRRRGRFVQKVSHDAREETGPEPPQKELGKGRRLRPEDWESPVEGYDAKGSAMFATKALLGVREGLYTKGSSGGTYKAWCKSAGAEIAAVEAGRKPVFHEEIYGLPTDVAEAATRLQVHLSGNLLVEAFGCHLAVINPKLASIITANDPNFYPADPKEAVMTMAEAGSLGELLGYGARTILDGDITVSFFHRRRAISGFVTYLDGSEAFIEARAHDYAMIFGRVTVEVTTR
jgi:hypothetical protein